jgi:hypothetical protein
MNFFGQSQPEKQKVNEKSIFELTLMKKNSNQNSETTFVHQNPVLY